MGDYFKPWRRKIGVLALVMACVFAAGWIRSHAYNDTIDLSFNVVDGSNVYEFCSERLEAGYCSLGYYFFRFSQPEGGYPSIELFMLDQLEDAPRQFTSDVEWQANSFGFLIGRAPDRQPRPNQQQTIIEFKSRIVPYWSLVIPLTLLSGWLLLSKPRTKNTPEKQAATN